MDEPATIEASAAVDTPAAPAMDANDWRSSLPEDLRGNATLQNYKGVEDLAKAHVHAQRLIGAEKIPLPGKDASPDDWNAVWNRLGRPENADGYQLPEDLMPEGVELDSTLTKTYLEKFHEAGLSQKQAEHILRSHGTVIKEMIDAQEQSHKESIDMGRSTLRKEWGRAYDQNLDHARKQIREFGSPELQARFTDEALLADPALTRMLATIGTHMRGDIGFGAANSDSRAMSPDQAQTKINELMFDMAFQQARSDPASPGHRAANEKWRQLHEYAAPS